MPDRHNLRAPRHRTRHDPLTAAAKLYSEEQQQRSRARDLFTYTSWQEEAWAFFDSLGEFAWSVEWLAKALSRVRLLAAEQTSAGDEPIPMEDGPAAELIERIGRGVGGHSEILEQATVQLSVPGEGWLVGEQPAGGPEQWRIYSTAEIQQSTKPGSEFEVLVDDSWWRPVDPNSLVTRIWDKHPRLQYQATSSARYALPVMRRIDLLDRRIVSTLVSRLAMNGMMLIPNDGQVSVPAQYNEAADPFVAYLIDIASNNIKNPGSASAAIPMPVRYSSELIDKWKHLEFGDGLAAELLEARDKELRRLATALNVPAEIVLGLGESNHWTAWQLEESAIKLHVAPMAEKVCHALTVGYLWPVLSAAGVDLTGPNGGQLVCWYDVSELTARPDKSDQAFRAYDRMEINGLALRRETGFDEGDAPTPDDLAEQMLKRFASSITLGPTAYEHLTGTPLQRAEDKPPSDGPAGGPGEEESEPDRLADPDADEPAAGPSGGERQPPGTRGQPPPEAAALLAALASPQFLPPADREPRVPIGATNGHHRPQEVGR